MTRSHSRKRVLDPAFVIFSIAYLLINVPGGFFGVYKADIVTSLGTSLDELLSLYSTAEYLYAAMLIPASLLIVRFSPGSLAWVALALEGFGLCLQWLATDVMVFFLGYLLVNACWALAIPLVGQIARNRMTTAAFVVATTLVFCLGQGLQAIGLLLAEMLSGSVTWRMMYLYSMLSMIPATIIVWLVVRPSVEFQSGSVRATLGIAWNLVRSPILWLAALASALFLGTIFDFGFIWNINFQKSLGWDPDRSTVLTFVFLIGVIIGGVVTPMVSRWIGAYVTMLIGMSYGSLVFGVVVFITPGRTHMGWAVPALLTMGIGFGSCSMILPYFAHFFDTRSSAIFFAVGSMVNSVLTGLLISLPIWVESKAMSWTTMRGLEAMFPYFFAFVLGLSLYLVLGVLDRLLYRREQAEWLVSDEQGDS